MTLGEFGRELAIKSRIACGPADVNSDVLTFGPTQFLKALPKCCNAGLSFRIFLGKIHEHSDALYPLGLLRQSRERQSRDRSTTDHFEKLAPSHRHPRDSKTGAS